MRALVLVLAALFALASGSGAALADATGKALGVDQDARAQTKTETKVLQVGADVFIGDKVITDARGQVQLLFSDSTRLVVGPNSALVIEDYLLRNDGSGGKFAVNALAGTFRFITGKAAKDRYLIETPTGTIGVRGTRFDFTVLDRYFAVLLYDGITRLCATSGRCATMDGACEVGMADSVNAVLRGLTPQMTTELRNQARTLFPYAVNDSVLLRQFRIATSDDCFDRLLTQPPQEGEGDDDTDDDDGRSNPDDTNDGVSNRGTN